MDKPTSGHFLMGCRFDNWLRLLRENGAYLDPARLPQAAMITATSAALYPAALLEKALYDKRIRETEIAKPPIFVLGHWRSGTTYLQDVLSRDPQFGWFDPVHTVVMPYSLLLGRALTNSVKKGIAAGRPMDNMSYDLHLPMEEAFAMLTINPHDIDDMIAFPARPGGLADNLFLRDLPEEERKRWREDYLYLLKKQTYVCGGKQLILKSPGNTAQLPDIMQLFPDAYYINIHRDPYTVVRSTVNMFLMEMETLRMTLPPENAEETIEDAVIGIFERMYHQLFSLQRFLPENRFAEVAYTDFCADPVESLRQIYAQLELDGFDNAEPLLRAYAADKKNYKKNVFDYPVRLIRKINDRLGFYFEHYGYEKREEK